MLVGSPDLGEDGLFYNSAFLIDRDGRIAGRYDKRHLVPFGEYVPLHWLFFFLDKLVVASGISDGAAAPPCSAPTALASA